LTKEAARLAPMPVNRVTTEDVLAVLQPLWQTGEDDQLKRPCTDAFASP